MAVVFKLEEISLETKRELLNELTLVPKDPYQEKMKRWGQQTGRSAPAIPVQMFVVDSETKTVRIPFHCAMQRMGVKPNRNKIYPRLSENGPPKFHATLREYQKKPIAEAYAQLQKNSTTTLGLYTGWGKTMAGVYLAAKANGVIMVLSHRGIIADSWVTTVEICLPQLVDSLCYVGKFEAKREIPIPRKCEQPTPAETACGLCQGCTGPQLTTPSIIICLDGRIHKVPKHVREAVMVTIIDEADLFCTPERVECLLSTEPKFVIAETATLTRPDGMESMIYSLVGKEGVFREPEKPYRIYRIKTGIKVPLTQGKRGLDFNDMTKKLIHSDERNQQAVDCVVCNPHRKVIIFVRQKEHIPLLGELLKAKGIEYATLFGNQSTYKDSRVLIGTIPKMGVGFDEKNACPDFQGRTSDLLILLTSIAELKVFIQVKGRLRCNDPVVFYFEDNLAVVKKHIRATLDYVTRTKGEVYDFPYAEGEMFIPNLDYSSGEAVEVGPSEEEVALMRAEEEEALAKKRQPKPKTVRRKIVITAED